MNAFRRLRRPLMLLMSLLALVFLGARFMNNSRVGKRGRSTPSEQQADASATAHGDESKSFEASDRARTADPTKHPDGTTDAGPSTTSTAGQTGAFYSTKEGRLYFALEGEVLDATSGRPVTTFVVEATRVRSLGYGGPSSVQVERVDQPDGRFRLEGLGLGEWRVSGRAEGYAPSAQSLMLEAVDADPFLVIPLSGGAEVSGQVIDPRSRPVAEARVGLESCFSPKPPKGCRIVTTGNDGRFLLSGAPADEVFAVRAEHPRYGDAVRRNLRRLEGETEHVVLELSGILKVYGRVSKGAGEAPLASAQIRVRDPELETKTKPDGTYELFMPATAQPDVRVVRMNRDGSPVELTSYPKGRSAEPIRWVEAQTHVAELEKNFQLESENARLYGRVTDDQGRPIAEVRLSLANSRGWKRGGRSHETFPVETLTQPDGRYEIEHIPSQAGYDVRARIKEGEWVTLGYVNVPDESDVEANFQLGSGSIRGRFVHAETGALFRMAARDCQGLGAERIGAGSFFIGPQCHEDGRFEVEKVPPGRYRLQDRTPWTGPAHEVTPVEVDVGPGQIVDGVELRVKGEEADTWKVRITDERGRMLSSPQLRYEKDRTLYTSSLRVGVDGVASFSVSRAHPVVHIDHTGHRPEQIELAGRDKAAIIEVRLRRGQ